MPVKTEEYTVAVRKVSFSTDHGYGGSEDSGLADLLIAAAGWVRANEPDTDSVRLEVFRADFDHSGSDDLNLVLTV